MRNVFALLMLSLLLVTGCGVKIETGQSESEARESSETRASAMRREWAERFMAAPPAGRANLMLQTFRQTAEQYFTWAEDIASRWRSAEQQNGREISAADMRLQIDTWIAQEKPVLAAIEDNLRFGRAEIERDGSFDAGFVEWLDQMDEQYNEVYNAVFLPNIDRVEYEYQISSLRDKVSRFLTEFELEISRF